MAEKDKNILGIGDFLQAARNSRGASLEQIAQELHIKIQYLRAIENEKFDSLPNFVSARGFLKNYVEYLGLENEGILEKFDKQLGQIPPKPAITIEPEKKFVGKTIGGMEYTRRRMTRSKMKKVAMVVLPVFIVLLGIHLYLKSSVGNIDKITDQAHVDLQRVVTPEQLRNEIMVEGVSVRIKALEDTLVRVFKDGVFIFNNIIEKGEEVFWEGRQYVKIKVGNGKTVKLEVNGRPFGRLSDEPVIVEKTFYPQDNMGQAAASGNMMLTPTENQENAVTDNIQ